MNKYRLKLGTGPFLGLARGLLYGRRHRKLSRFVKRAFHRPPVLLMGPPKSGNTFFRFVYVNLIRISNNRAAGPISYEELNRMQPHDTLYTDLGLTLPSMEFGQMPVLYSAHIRWYRPFNELFSTVFIFRNPLDTGISDWHYSINARRERRGEISLDDHVVRMTHLWSYYFAASFGNSHHFVRYEDITSRSSETFGMLFQALRIPFSQKDLERALKISDLRTIRAMEDATGQYHGMATKDQWIKEPGNRFARSGRVGQWKERLDPRTVKEVFRIVESYGIDTADIVWE